MCIYISKQLNMSHQEKARIAVKALIDAIEALTIFNIEFKNLTTIKDISDEYLSIFIPIYELSGRNPKLEGLKSISENIREHASSFAQSIVTDNRNISEILLDLK